MNTIWKFELPAQDRVQIEMPQGAKLLCVESVGLGAFDYTLTIWAHVQSDRPKVRRQFAVVGTGHPMPDEAVLWAYVGTVIFRGGALVFHLFDLGEV